MSLPTWITGNPILMGIVTSAEAEGKTLMTDAYNYAAGLLTVGEAGLEKNLQPVEDKTLAQLLDFIPSANGVRDMVSGYITKIVNGEEATINPEIISTAKSWLAVALARLKGALNQ